MIFGVKVFLPPTPHRVFYLIIHLLRVLTHGMHAPEATFYYEFCFPQNMDALCTIVKTMFLNKFWSIKLLGSKERIWLNNIFYPKQMLIQKCWSKINLCQKIIGLTNSLSRKMFIQQNVDINVMFAKEKLYPNNLVQYVFNPKQYMSKKFWSSFVKTPT